MDKKFCNTCGEEIKNQYDTLVIHGKGETLRVQFFVVDDDGDAIPDKDVCASCVIAEACSPGSPRARKKGGAQ